MTAHEEYEILARVASSKRSRYYQQQQRLLENLPNLYYTNGKYATIFSPVEEYHNTWRGHIFSTIDDIPIYAIKFYFIDLLEQFIKYKAPTPDIYSVPWHGHMYNSPFIDTKVHGLKLDDLKTFKEVQELKLKIV